MASLVKHAVIGQPSLERNTALTAITQQHRRIQHTARTPHRCTDERMNP